MSRASTISSASISIKTKVRCTNVSLFQPCIPCHSTSISAKPVVFTQATALVFKRVEKVLLLSTIHWQLHKRCTCNHTTWLNTSCLKDKYCYKKISVYLEINNTNQNNLPTNLFCYSDHLPCSCSEISFFVLMITTTNAGGIWWWGHSSRRTSNKGIAAVPK